MYAAYAVAAFCAARGMTSDEADLVYRHIRSSRAAEGAGDFFRQVEAAIALVKANR